MKKKRPLWIGFSFAVLILRGSLLGGNEPCTTGVRGKVVEICHDSSGLCLEADPQSRSPLRVFDRRNRFVTRASLGEVIEIDSARISYEGSPCWGLDGKSIYFLGSWSDTAYSLVRWQFAEGKLKRLVSVEWYDIVRKGEYAGHLAVRLRKNKIVGLWQWYWLTKQDFEIEGPIGDRSDLVRFMDYPPEL